MALVLVLTWLPLPEESARQGEPMWLLELFAAFGGKLVGVLIGLVFVILYWRRNNQLLKYLQRTEDRHTTLGILAWNQAWLSYIPISRPLSRST